MSLMEARDQTVTTDLLYSFFVIPAEAGIQARMEITIQKKTLLTGAVLLLIIGGIWFLSRGNQSSATPYAGVKGADLPAVVGEAGLTSEKIPYTETENYKEYTPEVLATALKSGTATLLYFYADWCTSCREQEPHLEQFFKDALQKKRPMVGIRVNVDTEKAVSKQFGVSYQTTFVLLGKDGKTIKKFFGVHTPEQMAEEMKGIL